MRTSVLVHISRLVIPFIQVFGIYVMLFGHISPGGGFAGGSIVGASLILSRYVYGREQANRQYPYHRLKWIASLSLMGYGLIKGTVFVLDFYHLNPFGLLKGAPGSLLSGGFIMPLNLLVGLVVAIVFYLIAILFEEGELDETAHG